MGREADMLVGKRLQLDQSHGEGLLAARARLRGRQGHPGEDMSLKHECPL